MFLATSQVILKLLVQYLENCGVPDTAQPWLCIRTPWEVFKTWQPSSPPHVSDLVGAKGDGGFPSGTSGKEPTCQCRRRKRRGFDLWVRKIPWSREWQPTPVCLPGESHGQRSLAGYSPWGHIELDTTKRLNSSSRSKGDRVPCPASLEQMPAPALKNKNREAHTTNVWLSGLLSGDYPRGHQTGQEIELGRPPRAVPLNLSPLYSDFYSNHFFGFFLVFFILMKKYIYLYPYTLISSCH